MQQRNVSHSTVGIVASGYALPGSDIAGFLRCFRDPRIENRVPRISENYHRVPKIRENRVPRINEIGTLQVHTGYLTCSLKKTWI